MMGDRDIEFIHSLAESIILQDRGNVLIVLEEDVVERYRELYDMSGSRYTYPSGLYIRIVAPCAALGGPICAAVICGFDPQQSENVAAWTNECLALRAGPHTWFMHIFPEYKALRTIEYD